MYSIYRINYFWCNLQVNLISLVNQYYTKIKLKMKQLSMFTSIKK